MRLKKIVRKIKESYLTIRYHEYASTNVIDWSWDNCTQNRIAIVNHFLALKGGQNARYLEIGCQSNALFNAVISRNKIGVDPISGGNIRVTSDDYFKDLDSEVKFDVIFIDGLHEYQQVRKDCQNALNHLEDDGVVMFHDILPSNWKEQHLPRIQKIWTGDVWKLAWELHNSTGIDFKIGRFDMGVGVLKKKGEYQILDLSNELDTAKFDFFYSIKDELPVIEYDEVINHFSKNN